MDTLTPDNLEVFAQLAWKAVQTGNAWLIFSFALVLVVYLVRKFLGPRVPFLQTQAGGAILTLVGSFAGATGSALMAGQAMNPALALAAFKVAFTASGGWTLVKHLMTLIKTADAEKIKAEAEAAGKEAAAKTVPQSLRDAFKDGTK